jgi:hypothetical protein
MLIKKFIIICALEKLDEKPGYFQKKGTKKGQKCPQLA